MRVLITGAAGHIGRALTDAYMRQGDEVDTLDMPGKGCNYSADLDVEQHIPGRMNWDIVICNAKCQSWKMHHVLAERAKVAIVNVASIYGVVGNDPHMYGGTGTEPTPAWYAASKGAMIALTKWQATNLAPVRSNAVILGGIERGHSELFVQRYTAKVPLRRMATEQDAVEAIMFLASHRASYITGACLAVDGGLTACA